MPPQIKIGQGLYAHHYVCAGCTQPKVSFGGGGTQEKRDKGYVLEQLSAAAKKKTVLLFFPPSIFIFHPSLFLGGLYISSAIHKKGKGFFPNNRRDCITLERPIGIQYTTPPALSLSLLVDI